MEGGPQKFYQRFNRTLERYLPRGLYRRSLIILVAPIILLQLITGGIFLDRYWDQTTKVLGRALSNEIGLLIELYERTDRTQPAITDIETLSRDRLKLELKIERGKPLPLQADIPFYALFDNKMQKYLARETGKPFWVDSSAKNEMVDIRVEVEPGLVFHFLTEQERAYAVNTPVLVSLMLLSTILLTTVAVVFLRNQVKPVLDLARAAQSFGLGRDVSSYTPRGAAEVRLAGQAFLDMKRRIARHVEQRTAMLAGVSHDLRTIITRFKLELAMLGDDPKLAPLKSDVEDMQRMLEDYMNFVRGGSDEVASTVNVTDVLEGAARSADRTGKRILIKQLPEIDLPLRPNAFRRLLDNVFGNALRYGKHVEVSGDVKENRLWIYVDDDGPGIPPEKREDVFRPFVRLDEARNMDETGTGLGLAIALDIAHAHGGDINLEESPIGGLRVAVKVPV
jgi:two-component system, OmpR family, osmolarity sensor histidine kinase EnvZ